MRELSWGKHALILVALVVNLWVGGDLVELWLGRGARSVFEIALILGYMTLIIGMRAPLPWRRRREEGEERDGPPSEMRERSDRDRDHDPTRGL